ncbi:MAG: hypothetical protein HOH75_05380 [Chloroflexi bacterium]|nr:hypothetical protein [Chloroflexota bacterium]
MQEELLSIWNKNKKTVFFVTHDIDEAILLADRVIVMTDRPGKIHADINIKLDRPREITVMDNSEFKRIKWEIWNFLEKEVRKELSL